jgi:hypothetical protein
MAGIAGEKKPARRLVWRVGAEDGIRTHDLLLGKQKHYPCATSAEIMERDIRIELMTKVWKTLVLPLN